MEAPKCRTCGERHWARVCSSTNNSRGGRKVNPGSPLQHRGPSAGVAPGPREAKRGRPRIEDAAKTLVATKPWEAIGLSERTWFRRQAENRSRPELYGPKLAKRIAAGEKIIWHVYELIDPRSETPFYIGCTTAPRARTVSHRTDTGSAAWSVVQEIHAAGLKCRLRTVAKYSDKESARAHEDRLIEMLPGLVNRCWIAKHRAKPK